MTIALIYHDVVDPQHADEAGFPGPVAARYKLAPAHFDHHLDAIEASGAHVGLAAPGGGAPAALTFDDGGASAPRIADALERRGWRGHFFVTTAKLGEPGFMEHGQVRELAERGHAVGSHSHTHPGYMGRLPEAEILDEWRRSRELLAELLGEAPASASVPGGYTTAAVVGAAERAGYELLMTSEPTARTRRHGALTVLGRYAIWASTPPARAAAYARGSLLPRARLLVGFRVKQAAKRASPKIYETARRVRASGGT